MPNDLPLLGDLLVLLLASVPIAFLFNRLRLPTIVGFMLARRKRPTASDYQGVHAIECWPRSASSPALTICWSFAPPHRLDEAAGLVGGGTQVP